MNRINLEKDIQPLSEFRSKIAHYFEKVKETKRPLIITQHGKSAAILMDITEYELMIEKLEILEDIKLSESQIEEGLVLSHAAVKKISDR